MTCLAVCGSKQERASLRKGCRTMSENEFSSTLMAFVKTVCTFRHILSRKEYFLNREIYLS